MTESAVQGDRDQRLGNLVDDICLLRAHLCCPRSVVLEGSKRLSSEESASATSQGEAARGVGESLRIIGPGLVLAATTVGIGDFISNAVAGERYGMTFAWAIVLAVVLKYFLTEGLGR
jgi:hypothetical protein